MCQLTLVNLGSPFLNRTHTYNQAVRNSTISHKDGCGFYIPGEPGYLFKTQFAASALRNYGFFLEKIKTPEPVMSHVRLASYGFKNIIDENSHPFELSSIVLAHNGSLEFKDDKVSKEERFKNKIDSEMFAMVLNDIYEKNHNMITSLKEAYSQFRGKFAFIIYAKPEKKFYIARGKQAKLYHTEVHIFDNTKENYLGDFIGFVVNTDNIHLDDALVLTSNLFQASGGKRLAWKTPEELPENSIFSVDHSTILIHDKILEEEKPVATYTYGGYAQTGFLTEPAKVSTTTTTTKIKYSLFVDKLVDFMWSLGLSVKDLDQIFYIWKGKPLLSSFESDISDFVNKVIPALLKESSKEKNIIKEWGKLKNTSDFMENEEIITEGGLSFPYFLNPVSDVRRARRDIISTKQLNSKLERILSSEEDVEIPEIHPS